MNSPLPKPTPPANTDDKQQNVVFDQNKQTDDKGRIPLAQKNDDSKVGPDTSPISAPKPTLPPTSLSALSSMSSNKIPLSSAASQIPTTPMPQKTVLGQPIPQTIRGESVPPALSKPSFSTPQASTQATTQASTQIRTENPSFSDPGKGGSSGKSSAPKIAQAKSPIMKLLPFIAGGIVLLVIIVLVLSRFLGSGSTSVSQEQGPGVPASTAQPGQRTEVPAEKVVLEYWGLWEPTEVIQQVIDGFESENPGIEVNYVKQSHIDYRERLQTAFQSGSGPDLFRFHASWVPMLKSNLDPIPASVVSTEDFRNNYYPVVTDQLVSSGQYVGLPLMYDGLVLYYNEDILTTASETPPATWPELRSLAIKLTVPSATGIQRGGLAIGNSTNVEHFSDILATLILQNGGDATQADSVEVRDALLFYTNFQLRDKVWDESLPTSTVAFARGDVAMMFAPSWRAHDIKALNPELNFATAPMPQLSDDEKISWASYWAEGISASSSKKTEAATFLAYLNREDILRQFFSEASKIRAFGEIYPKVSMVDELADNEVVASILQDAIYAKSGYLNSFTHDNGINDLMIDYYKSAVDALVDSANIEEVQTALDQGVAQVLKQYNVSTE